MLSRTARGSILDNAASTQQRRFKIFFVIFLQARDLIRAGAAAHFQMVNKNIVAQLGQLALETRFLRRLLQKLHQIEIGIFLLGRVQQLDQLVYAMRFHLNIVQ